MGNGQPVRAVDNGPPIYRWVCAHPPNVSPGWGDRPPRRGRRSSLFRPHRGLVTDLQLGTQHSRAGLFSGVPGGTQKTRPPVRRPTASFRLSGFRISADRVETMAGTASALRLGGPGAKGAFAGIKLRERMTKNLGLGVKKPGLSTRLQRWWKAVGGAWLVFLAAGQASAAVPSLVLDGGAASFTEGNIFKIITPAATASDADDDWDGGTLLVEVTGNASTNDFLGLFAVKTGTNLTVNGTIYGTVNTVGYIEGSTGYRVTFNGVATNGLVEAVVRGMAVISYGDAPSTATRTVTFTLTDAAGNSVVATREMTFTAVNDAPTITAGSAIAVNEDQLSPLTGITLADPDAETATVTVTFSLPAGTLHAPTSAGVVAAGSNSTTLILEGTVDDLNTFIAAGELQYLAATNAITNLTLTVTIDDGGNSGTGGALDDTQDITLDVNEQPILGSLNGDSVAFVENSPGVRLDAAGDATVTDPDSSDFTLGKVTVTIVGDGESSEDALAIDATAGVTVFPNWELGAHVLAEGQYFGMIDSIGSGGDPLVIRFYADATTSRVQALVRSLMYTNTSDTPLTTSRTVLIQLDDAGGARDYATVTVSVASTNDAPEVTPTAEAGRYLVGVGGFYSQPIDPNLVLADPDSSTLSSGTVMFSTNFVAGEDMLTYTNAGFSMGNIIGSYSQDGDQLLLTSAGGTATLAQWQAALRSVGYMNTSSVPSLVTRGIRFVVNDGSSEGSGVRDLQVAMTNQVPEVGLPASFIMIRDEAFALTAITLTNADDNGSYVTARLVVEPTNTGGFAGAPAVDVDYEVEESGALFLGGTLSALNAYLAGGQATFTVTGEVVVGTSLRVEFNDQGQGYPDEALTVTNAASILYGNAAPVWHATKQRTATYGSELVLSDDGPAVDYPAILRMQPLLGVITNLSVDLNGLTHEYPADLDVLLVGPHRHSVVLLSDAGGASPVNNVTLNLSDAMPDFVLDDGVTSGSFRPTNRGPINHNEDLFLHAPQVVRAAELSAFEGTSPSGSWELYIWDDAEEDVGVLQNWMVTVETDVDPLPETATIIADVNTMVSVGELWLSDDDAASSELVVRVTADVGTLHWSSEVDSIGTGVGTGVLEFSGNLSQLNAALGGLQYLPPSNFVGTATVTLEVDDQGATGGVAEQDILVVTVDVRAPDEAPVLSPGRSAVLLESPNLFTVVAPQMTITDADSTNLSSATLYFGRGYVPFEDELLFANDGVTMGDVVSSFELDSGVLQLVSPGGHATLAEWQSVLRSIVYTNHVVDPNLTAREIVFEAASSQAISDRVSVFLHLNTDNTAPRISFQSAWTLTNATVLDIPIGGPATNSPSEIAISNLLGTVAGLTVTLHGLSHYYPEDLDILLVGPDGTAVVLMSDSGVGAAANDLTVTFSDAGELLPRTGSLGTGPWAPWNYSGSDPDEITGGPSVAWSTALSAFTGRDPNGTWRLFVEDDFFDDGGVLAGGWSLSLTTSANTNVLTILEDAGGVLRTIANWGASLSDDDAHEESCAVSLVVEHGTLSLGTLAGLSGVGQGTFSLSYTGTLANLNEALVGLRFDPETNWWGSAELTLTLNDLGATGRGGPLSAVTNVTIVVLPVDDPVQADVPASVLLLEDTPGEVTGISLVDPDNENGVEWVSVRVDSSVGELRLVELPETVSAFGVQGTELIFGGALSDLNQLIAEGHLQLVPRVDYVGSGEVTILRWDFSGDTPTQIEIAAVDLDILPVNDPPSFRLLYGVGDGPVGEVVTWVPGSNGVDRLPAEWTNLVAVASGTDHIIGLRDNGTVVGLDVLGLSRAGTIPDGLSGVTAIVANDDFSAALKRDGTVTAWGRTSWQSNSVPADLDSVRTLVAGDRFLMALRSNGTVVAWSPFTAEQTYVPADLTNVAAIAAGGPDEMESVAVLSNDVVRVWSQDLGNPLNLTVAVPGIAGLFRGYTSRTAFALFGDGTLYQLAWGDGTAIQTNSFYTGIQSMAASRHVAVFQFANGSITTLTEADGFDFAPVGLTDVVWLGAGGTALAIRETPYLQLHFDEDSGVASETVLGSIDTGGGDDEVGQSVSFSVTTDRPELFSDQPTISSNGVLTFTGAPNANGTAIISVVAMDNGGTAVGGVDTSGSQSFAVVIDPVDDWIDISVPSPIAFREDTFYVLTNLVLTDPTDMGELIEVHLRIDSGNRCALDAWSSAEVYVVNVSAEDIDLTGTLSAINEFFAAGRVSVVPVVNEFATFPLLIEASDLGRVVIDHPRIAQAYTTVDIASVNDAPVWHAVRQGTWLQASTGYNNSTLDFGPAFDFPWTNRVSGLIGNITNITVQLFGLAHERPEDLDVLLVGPTGEAVMLISDTGASTYVQGVDLTITDAGPQPLAGVVPLVSGSYFPTDQELGDYIPGAPRRVHQSDFQGFLGTGPVGDWHLYVFDDRANQSGAITSWALNIETDCEETPTTANAGAVQNRELDLSGLSLSDLDPASRPMTLRVTADYGTVSFADPGDLVGSGQGTDHLAYAGSVAELNLALAGLRYMPASNFVGEAILRLAAEDPGADGEESLTNMLTLTITVRAPDLAPVLEGTTVAFYDPTSGGTLLQPTFSVSDPDSSGLGRATITISSNLVSSEDELLFSNDGVSMGAIEGVYDGDNGRLYLWVPGEGMAPLSEWRAALRSITYTNRAGSNAVTLRREVTFEASSESAVSDPLTFSLFVNSENEAPRIDWQTVLNLTNSSSVAIPDIGPATPSSMVVSNVAGNILSLEVTLHGLSHAYPADLDVVLVAPDGTPVVLISDAGGDIPIDGVTLRFSDTGTPIYYFAAIPSGTYVPVNYEGNDLFTGGPLGGTGNTMAAFNGLNPNGTWTLFVEDDDAEDEGMIAGGWSLSLVADGGTNQFTIQEEQTFAPGSIADWRMLLSDADAGDRPCLLNVSTSSGVLTADVSGVPFSDGVGSTNLVLFGELTDLNLAMASLEFAPETNFSGTAVLTFTLDDLGATGLGPFRSATNQLSVVVSPVNDLPSIQVPATISSEEDNFALMQNIVLTDGDDVGLDVELTLSADSAAGAFYIWTEDGDVVESGSGTSSYTLRGTLAAINNLLNTETNAVIFVPWNDVNGTVTVLVTFRNLGHGGADFDEVAGSTTLEIAAVNDPPTFALRYHHFDGPEFTGVYWAPGAQTVQRLPGDWTNLVAIAGGDDHIIGLRADGSLVGIDFLGQYSAGQVPNLSNVIAIAAGDMFSFALLQDGTIEGWGDNRWGQIDQPSTPNGFVAIASGSRHTLALRGDGTVGVTGGSTNNLIPFVPDDLTNVMSVAAGEVGVNGFDSIALLSNGVVRVWVGMSSADYEDLSIEVPGAAQVLRGLSYNTGLARLEDGSILNLDWSGGLEITTNLLGPGAAQGAGGHGLFIGVGDGPITWTPESGLLSLPIDLGPVFSVGLRTNGFLAVEQTTRERVNVVEDSGPASLDLIRDLSAGPDDESGQTVRFEVTATDPSLFSRLPAVSATGTLTFTPAPNAYGTTVVSVVAIDDGGTSHGGIDTSAPQSFTIAIESEEDWLDIAVPERVTVLEGIVTAFTNLVLTDLHDDGITVRKITLSIAPDEDCFLWARSSSSVLVAQDVDEVIELYGTLPALNAFLAEGQVLLDPRKDIYGEYRLLVQVTDIESNRVARASTTLAIQAVNDPPSIRLLYGQFDGLVTAAVTWTTDGGVMTPLSPDWTNLVAIAGGLAHIVGLNADGTVVATEEFGFFRADRVPPGLSNVVAVAAGHYHTLALRSDGTVVAWGNNAQGQTNVPAGLSSVRAIAAGDVCSMALRDDGTVVTWGGQGTSPPADLTDVMAIAAGWWTWAYGHDNAALLSNGTVRVWYDPGGGRVELSGSVPGATNIVMGPDVASVYAQLDDGSVVVVDWSTGTMQVSGAMTGVSTLVQRGWTRAVIYADGRVEAKDVDSSSLAPVPAGLTNVIAIGATDRFPLAIHQATQQQLHVSADAGPVSVLVATNISAGPENESDQTVLLVATADAPGLFTAGPTISSDGVLSFTLAPNAFGQTLVTIEVWDSGGIDYGGVNFGTPRSFNLVVSGSNAPPVVSLPSSIEVLEDTVTALTNLVIADLNGDVGNMEVQIDVDPELAELQGASDGVVQVYQNDPGTIVLRGHLPVLNNFFASGGVQISPLSDQVGAMTMTVSVADFGHGREEQGAVGIGTTTIELVAVNDPPDFTLRYEELVLERDASQLSILAITNLVAGPDNESGQVVSLSVSVSDPLMFTDGPTISSDGVVTGVIAPGVAGTNLVTIHAVDDGGAEHGGVDERLRTFAVVMSHDHPPVAVVDSYELNEDELLTVDVGEGLLSNDLDADGDPFAAAIVTDVTHGVLNLFGDGSFTYRPETNFNGLDQFEYQLFNQYGTSAVVTVTLTVQAINDTPVLVAFANEVPAGRELSLLGVLAFDDSGTGTVSLLLSSSTVLLDALGTPEVTVFNDVEEGNLWLSGSVSNLSAYVNAGEVHVSVPPNVTTNLTLVLTLDDDGHSGADPGLTGTAMSEVVSVTNVIAVVPAANVVRVPAAGTYGPGDVLQFVIETTEIVNVDTNPGVPFLTLILDSTNRVAGYVAGSGTTNLFFEYQVQAGDRSATNEFSIGSMLDLGGGLLRDVDDQAMWLSLDAIESTAGIAIDGRASVVSLQPPADQWYPKAGRLEFAVTFDAPVEVSTTGGVPRLALTLGNTNAWADYVSISGNALIFAYVVRGDDLATNGITVDRYLDPNGGTIRDLAGDDARIDLGSTTTLPAVRIDGVPPTFAYAVHYLDRPVLGVGDAWWFAAYASEPVTVDTNLGIPMLEYQLDSGLVYAGFVSNDTAQLRLHFSYAVQPGDVATNALRWAENLSLNGASIRDAAGNPISAAIPPPYELSAFQVDGVTPGFIATNLPGAGVYQSGQHLDFGLQFTETVTNEGVSSVSVVIGNTRRTAVPLGTTALSNTVWFRYTVQTGDFDADGILVEFPDPFPAGAFRDLGGNAVTMPSLESIALPSVRVDASAPVAMSPSFEMGEDGGVLSASLLSVVVDADTNTLSWELVADVGHGTLGWTGNGSFTYQPATNFAGSDSFRYRISDGILTSGVATVSLTLHPTNDPPTITGPARITVTNGVPVPLTGLIFGDVDSGTNAVRVILIAGDLGSMVMATNRDGVTTTNDAAVFTHFWGSVSNLNTYFAASNVFYVAATNRESHHPLHVLILDHGSTGFDPGIDLDSDGESATWSMQVNNGVTNHAPQIGVGLTNITTTYGSAFSVTFPTNAFLEPDGQAMFYTASGMPAGITFAAETRTFSGTPETTGSFPVQLIAGDGQVLQQFMTNSFVLIVQPAVLTVTAADARRGYGAANPVLSAGITGYVLGDDASVVTGAAQLSTSADVGSAVGTYVITPSAGTLAASHYTFAFVAGTLTVTSALPVLSWGSPLAIAYGTALSSTQLNASANVAGTFVYSPTNGTILSAGSNQILRVSFIPTNSNYATGMASVFLSVAKAPLTVTAVDAARVVGATNPVFRATMTGFVNGDTTNVVTGSPALSTAADASSPAGVYPISCAIGSLAASNYSFSLVSGSLSVTSAILQITWTPPEPITYGQALTRTQLNATASYVGSFIYSPALGTVLDAGSNQTLRATFVPTDTNIASQSVSVNVTVNRARLWVTASNVARPYGVTNPPLEASFAGFVHGDTAAAIAGQPALATTAAINSVAGSYAINAAVGSLSASNYTFAFVDGLLTVNKAPLLARANDHSRPSGETNPIFTVSYTGLMNGETPSVLDLAPRPRTVATRHSGAGRYPIVLTSGQDNNYAFTLESGTLTVTTGTNASLKGVYAGLFFETNEVRHGSSGAFRLAVTDSGRYSGSLELGGRVLKVSGLFDDHRRASNVVTRPDGPPVNVRWVLDESRPPLGIEGSVADGSWTAPLFGTASRFDVRTNPAPMAGRYTMAMPGATNELNAPQGSGYGTILIKANGALRFVGALADGTKVSDSAVVGDTGLWPFYVLLYRKTGSAVGWVEFARGSASDLSGMISWIRPAQIGSPYYPAGFAVDVPASGSVFTPPPVGTRVVSFNRGTLTLTGGNLDAPVTVPALLDELNRITFPGGEAVTLKANPRDGRIVGTYLPGGSTKPGKLFGVVDQKMDAAIGFFLGTNQGGAFRLERAP